MAVRRCLPLLLVLSLLLGWAGSAAARQGPPGPRRGPPPGPPPAEALRVFLDCNAYCDSDLLRKEIVYVNWVRDRSDADIHLLITSERTGGGGQTYTMKYIGLRFFQGQDDEFTFSTSQGDTDDEVRRLVMRRIALGLTRYVAKGPTAARFTLSFTPPEGGAAGAVGQKPHDPWNLWVFTAGVNARFNGESQSSASELSGSLRAQRVDERWKFSASLRGSRNRSRYDLEDTVLRTRTASYSGSSQVVRSVGEHWSLGLNLNARRSTTDNYNLLGRLGPGIEWDLYPYRESTRRQFVLFYELGMSQASYRDTTIYDKLHETRPYHSLTAAIQATQPWGSVNGSLTGSNYLDDWSKNHLSLSTGCDVRIRRGLNFNMYVSYDRVRDQLFLEKAGASDNDILLRLKQLKTSYSYYIFTGLSYTFGSKFNNVVNPRFNSTGGGCMCMGGSCFCS